jgi:tetratricopeptide (TPR) repeat protein
MNKTLGGLMSFNNFLSTSRKRNISLNEFARPEAFKPDTVGILFVMNIDPKVCATSSIPFADVTKVGFFDDREEEILFTTHTIFRIDRIQRIEDKHTDRLWQVNLTLTGENDNHKLTSHIRKELSWTTGWSRLGDILIKLGESSKAEQLYKILLDEKASSDKDRADYNYQLGRVYDDMGEYSKALSSYERSLEIRKIALPPNHPSLAASYNNIGSVYRNMGEYSKALSSYERSLEIYKIALPPNHPDLAASYNNIGSVYDNMGEYSKALSYYEKDLEISQKSLPPNHLGLATSYNNIGSVYNNMGEYSKALSSYERSLEIRKIALPPNHPSLATSYNNIGSVYRNMGEYSKALSFYERSLEIKKIALPPNHPDLAASYNNIGSVYRNMGGYSEALLT